MVKHKRKYVVGEVLDSASYREHVQRSMRKEDYVGFYIIFAIG